MVECYVYLFICYLFVVFQSSAQMQSAWNYTLLLSGASSEAAGWVAVQFWDCATVRQYSMLCTLIGFNLFPQLFCKISGIFFHSRTSPKTLNKNLSLNHQCISSCTVYFCVLTVDWYCTTLCITYTRTQSHNDLSSLTVCARKPCHLTSSLLMKSDSVQLRLTSKVSTLVNKAPFV